MGVVTKPAPARLPLPGGRSGATVRVHPLGTGEILLPPLAFDRPTGRAGKLRGMGLHVPRSRWQWVPVPSFLIEHPGAGPLLVDTGFHASVAVDQRTSFNRAQMRLLPMRMTAGQDVPAQLRERGIEPEQISTILMTHLHNDHASGIPQFPQATFLTTNIEWKVASNGTWRDGYFHKHFDLPLDWRTVNYAAPDVAGHGPFNRSVDVFGDGAVRLLFTPGHTRGHQSVLLRLTGGELLLTADAAYTRRSIEEELVPIFCVDEHLYRRSLTEIRAYVAGTPEAIVICGHDPERWPGLDAVYE